MRFSVIRVFAKQVYITALGNRAVRVLLLLLAGLFAYAAYLGWNIYEQQTGSRLRYQKEIREHWEAMPDKHPHRMAHYGYIAIRPKHPLSFFDFGMESYTGNAVFLEAHRQNTVNFSEAGFSTGMLRFGEISMAMILQVLLPLVLFFIGFHTVAADRENGTLKIIFSQGVSWKELLFGKSLGLFALALTFLLPALLLLIPAGISLDGGAGSSGMVIRVLGILLCYGAYYALLSLLTVLVSASSKTAKLSLVKLIGIWLLFTVILPRTTQALGRSLHPAPSKISFESGIEQELIRRGDSHDPDDPYYQALKDSVLRAYKADSIQQLPFNYSGFQMKEGERISSEIYSRHLNRLLQTYELQNGVARASAFLNPFAALRHLSMAVCGTGFHQYTRFQQQAEAYRYRLAQHMNDLQIRLISNRKPGPGDKSPAISKEYWKAFPDFTYRGLPLSALVREEALSVVALLFWIILLVSGVFLSSKKLKAL